MTFDEWVDERIKEFEQFGLPHFVRLLKLVRAYREHRKQPCVAPSMCSQCKGIAALEAALIGK